MIGLGVLCFFMSLSLCLVGLDAPALSHTLFALQGFLTLVFSLLSYANIIYSLDLA